MPHILYLGANERGEDYVIGDPHGTYWQIHDLYQRLNPDDRIFSVGDNCDKGPECEKLLDLIINDTEIRATQGLPQRFFSTRGNHEELARKHIEVLIHPQKFTYSQSAQAIGLHIANKGNWVNTINPRKLIKYYEFFNSLPYYILVADPQPFVVVHAGRMQSWDELVRLAMANAELSEEEKKYCMWARVKGTKDSEIELIEETMGACLKVITYCGHTPLGGLRPSCNVHINLDLGAYKTGALCIVNHTRLRPQLVYTPPTPDSPLEPGAQTNAIFNLILIYFERILLNQAIVALDGRLEEMENWYLQSQRKKHVNAFDTLLKEKDIIKKRLVSIATADLPQLIITFRAMINLLEDAYERELHEWQRGWGIFKEKTSTDFTAFLNNDLNSYWPSHHYKRLLSVTLADLASVCPKEVKTGSAKLTQGIIRPDNYLFKPLNIKAAADEKTDVTPPVANRSIATTL